MDLISGISAAITAARAAGDYLEGNQDAQKKIIDLSLQLMDVQQNAMQLLQENSELRARLRELEAKRHLDDVVYYQDEVCWRKDKEGQGKGPFCHVCWEKERHLIHLEHLDVDDSDSRLPGYREYLFCHACKNTFTVDLIDS